MILSLLLALQLGTFIDTDLELFSADGQTYVVLKSTEKTADHAIIDLFYRRDFLISEKPVNLLLRKTVVVPAMYKIAVMSDPVDIPLSAITRIKVTYLQTLKERVQEFSPTPR